MMTDDERKLVDEIEKTQADFYAPLMALCLRRFSHLQMMEGTQPDDAHIRQLVLGAYNDLERGVNR